MMIDKIFHGDCFFCSRFLCVKENGDGIIKNNCYSIARRSVLLKRVIKNNFAEAENTPSFTFRRRDKKSSTIIKLSLPPFKGRYCINETRTSQSLIEWVFKIFDYSKAAYLSINFKFTYPVGPFRLFAMITSANSLSASSRVSNHGR